MKRLIILFAVAIIIAFVYFRQQNENYYDLLIVSGATPLAVSRKVPSDYSLTVNGLVKKEYRFSGSALNGFASTRIRTREFSPDGHFLGAYAYLGIPAFNILEGISPKKPDNTAFDQPLDMVVTFSSPDGKKVQFSYNELLMADDRAPVTLAYQREQILPTNEKVRENYHLNIKTTPLSGFRLICPREPDTTRYLDNVNLITYSLLPVPEDELPARRKGSKCESNTIICLQGHNARPADYSDIPIIHCDRWIRIGHGHGFDGVAKVAGFELQSFLKANFPGASGEDFFLFVSCDGYRCLFSGREIFHTAEGRTIIIARELDGRNPDGGIMLVSAADFFHDRAMWGLSHIVRLDITPEPIAER